MVTVTVNALYMTAIITSFYGKITSMKVGTMWYI